MKRIAIPAIVLCLAVLNLISLVSCSSTGTGPDSAIAKIAKIGNAYVQASPKISAQDKTYVALAAKVVESGKVDQSTLVTIAQAVVSEKLAGRLSAEEQAQILGVLDSVKDGKLDAKSLLSLAKSAAIAYAATQGVPPEAAAAVLALAETFNLG